MLTVQEAKNIVEEAIPQGARTVCSAAESLGRVTAADIVAPFDFPLFASSAMDGYAIRYEDTQKASLEAPVTLSVIGQIFAGDEATQAVESGQAIQIMTGAMVPAGASAVIPQENVQRHDDTIRISAPAVERAHIREQGEEIRHGAVALPAQTVLTPAVLGHLTALGIYEVPIFAPPRVAILPTGSELITDAHALRPGKIFESNSYALGAAVQEMGLTATISPPLVDQYDHLFSAIQESLETHDVILISGGVSVGEKDYIRDILAELKVETLFWKVAQKPGKPLYFGRRNDCFVFGLPGNPASSLACFYEYVRPALRKWVGHADIWPRAEQAVLQHDFSKKAGRAHFVRACAERCGGELRVSPFVSQESHRMASFAQANCLAVIPQDVSHVERGTAIEVHWLPKGDEA